MLQVPYIAPNDPSLLGQLVGLLRDEVLDEFRFMYDSFLAPPNFSREVVM